MIFFFNDTATTESYTLSLHDALPIWPRRVLRDDLRCTDLEWARGAAWAFVQAIGLVWYYVHSNPAMSTTGRRTLDRKSTRLNSSHANISYAVFCLKKKTLFSPTLPCY